MVPRSDEGNWRHAKKIAPRRALTPPAVGGEAVFPRTVAAPLAGWATVFLLAALLTPGRPFLPSWLVLAVGAVAVSGVGRWPQALPDMLSVAAVFTSQRLWGLHSALDLLLVGGMGGVLAGRGGGLELPGRLTGLLLGTVASAEVMRQAPAAGAWSAVAGGVAFLIVTVVVQSALWTLGRVDLRPAVVRWDVLGGLGAAVAALMGRHLWGWWGLLAAPALVLGGMGMIWSAARWRLGSLVTRAGEAGALTRLRRRLWLVTAAALEMGLGQQQVLACQQAVILPGGRARTRSADAVLTAVDTWDTSPQPTEGLQRLWTGAGRSLLSDAAGALGRVLWEEDLWAVDSHATPWEEQEPDISAILAALPVRWTAKGGSGLDLGADGLAALHTLGRNLRLDTDPLAVAAHLLGAADGSDAAAVFRLAGAGQWRLDAAKGWEAPTELSESPGSLLGEAVRTGRPAFGNASGEPAAALRRALAREGLRRLLCVPVAAGRKPEAVLLVARGLGAPFDRSETCLLSAAGALAGLRLENLALHDAQQREQQLVTRVLEQIGGPAFVVDATGCIRVCSGAARSLLADLGHSSPPEGVPLGTLFSGPDPITEALEGSFAREHQDLEMRGPEGSAVLNWRVTPLDGPSGQFAAMLVTALEPGDAQTAQRHQEGLVTLGQLAAGAAHEIRNPLTAIHGFVQLMEAQVENAVHRRHLQVIRREVERIEHITSDMLLLAKPVQDREAFCDLSAVASSVVELLRPKAAERGIRLEIEASVRLPQVHGERDRVEQVLLNVVGNAIESMLEPGAVRVRLHGSNGTFAAVSVADEGPGLPLEVMPRIFEPFFTTKAGGTGLGLAVSESIVRAYGGHIAVVNLEHGAEFTVRLPVHRAVQCPETVGAAC